ncbi:hypothetical protein CerSpe_153080 [Prunus speciosa]
MEDPEWFTDEVMEEQFTIHLEESLNLTDVRSGTHLAGFLIAEKEPLIGGVKNALRREWRNIVHSDDVKIAWANPNVYVITVESDLVAKKLIDRGPWYFHDDVFSLQEWPMNCSLDEIIPCKAAFWIQAHGIPLGQMTACNAKMLANRIGKEVLVEDPTKTGMRGFLRLRVEINTSRPLPLGFWLPRGQNERSWISLKYEGLRRFYTDVGGLGTPI